MPQPLVCVACGNNNRDHFNTTFYQFPKCPLSRDKWLYLLNLENISLKSTSRVCQQHFSKSQIVRIKLIKNAMPKNVRKQDNSSIYQGNSNVNNEDDEGLEKVVTFNNKSIRGGQRPTREKPVNSQPQLLLNPSPNISIGIVGWVVNGNVNVGMGTNARLLQPKPNVGVEDEGLEKAVICNNKLKRGGQKPIGELCLICAQLPDPLETNQPPLASYQLSSFLNPHLWSMFILKLLNFPKEECENVFIKTFGVNPGEWFRLCGPCFQIVEQAYTLEQEVAKLQKKLERAKSSARNKLEESLKLDKTGKRKSKGVFDISKYIRQVFKDIPTKNLLESTSTIKEEDETDEVEIKVDDDSPKPSNETVTSEYNDDTNITVKTEHVEMKESLLGGGGVNDDTTDVVILSNNVSKNYIRSNTKRKMAKKLMLTAIKRCRVLDSEEQKPPNPNLVKKPDNTSKIHQPLPTRLTCSLCPAKFVAYRNLKDHLDAHKKYVDTSCPKCNFPCDTPQKLKRHVTLKRCAFQGQGSGLPALSSELQEKHLKCHICNRVYPNQIQLANHLKNHQICKYAECPFCKFPCVNRKRLENHLKICNLANSSSSSGSQAQEFKCDLCGYTTDYPYVFSKHKRTHEIAKFNCEVCSFPSISREVLKIHMKQTHGTVLKNPTNKASVTKIQNRRGPGRISARDKVKKLDIGEDMISCHLCPTLFSSKQNLYGHVRNVHEKRFPCSECDSIFESQSLHRKHLLEKHGIETEKFICDTCGMQFSTYPGVYTHKKKFHSNLSSTNDKPADDVSTVEGGNKVSKYERKCPHCEVCCCNMKALKIHLRANHPDLYKHKCKLCPLTYISSGNLKIHMKNVHLKEEVECVKCKAKMRGSSMRGHLKLFCRFRPQTDDTNSSKISD